MSECRNSYSRCWVMVAVGIEKFSFKSDVKVDHEKFEKALIARKRRS